MRLVGCKLASLNNCLAVVEVVTDCGRFHLRLDSPAWSGHKLCWVRKRNLELCS